MTYNVLTLTAYIATQNIAGVTTIFDITNTPDEISERDCPALYPNLIADMASGSEVKRVTFGAGGLTSTEARRDLNYTLRYRLCYAPVGAGRYAVKTHAPGILTATGNILAKFISTTFDVVSGLVEIHPTAWTGPIASAVDPSGKEFYGADFQFIVREYTEQG